MAQQKQKPVQCTAVLTKMSAMPVVFSDRCALILLMTQFYVNQPVTFSIVLSIFQKPDHLANTLADVRW